MYRRYEIIEDGNVHQVPAEVFDLIYQEGLEHYIVCPSESRWPALDFEVRTMRIWRRPRERDRIPRRYLAGQQHHDMIGQQYHDINHPSPSSLSILDTFATHETLEPGPASPLFILDTPTPQISPYTVPSIAAPGPSSYASPSSASLLGTSATHETLEPGPASPLFMLDTPTPQISPYTVPSIASPGPSSVSSSSSSHSEYSPSSSSSVFLSESASKVSSSSSSEKEDDRIHSDGTSDSYPPTHIIDPWNKRYRTGSGFSFNAWEKVSAKRIIIVSPKHRRKRQWRSSKLWVWTGSMETDAQVEDRKLLRKVVLIHKLHRYYTKVYNIKLDLPDEFPPTSKYKAAKLMLTPGARQLNGNQRCHQCQIITYKKDGWDFKCVISPPVVPGRKCACCLSRSRSCSFAYNQSH